MPIPVPIPSGQLPVTPADTARAEAFVAALGQIFHEGTVGGSPNTPATIAVDGFNPPIDPGTGLPKLASVYIDTSFKQLHYRQLALAMAAALVKYANATTVGITRLSTDPASPAYPTALNSEEVTVTPTANRVPRARPDGTLDPAWITGGPGPGPVIQTFEGVCPSLVAVGDLVYITGSGKNVDKVDILNPAKMPSIGVVISKDSSTECLVQVGGIVSSVYSSLTPGALYFCSSSARLTPTRPNPPNIRQFVAAAVDETTFIFVPNHLLQDVDNPEAVGEVPSGDVNGTNRTFITTFYFRQGSSRLYLNGVRQELGSGFDYVEGVDLKSVVFELAPKAGDHVLIDYVK